MTMTFDRELESARTGPPALSEARGLLRLAWPLVFANLGQVLIGAVDTAVVGRLGETELGAVGLGNSLFFTVMVIGLGVMLGLDPLVSQAVGAEDSSQARGLLWQGSWIAIGLSLPLSGGVLLLGGMLERFGIAPESAQHARAYIVARLPGLLPFLIFVASRSYLSAIGVTRPMMLGVVLANLVNLPLSWLLVFGSAGLPLHPALGLPALGVAGAAWASTACAVLQMAVLLLAVQATRVTAQRAPDRALITKALRLGTPIGLTLLAEFGVFALVNLLMGNLEEPALAAHQVAITLASATFMVPVGIGAAAAVRVGHAVGRRDQAGTRLAGITAIVAGASFMALAALMFLFLPGLLARVITDKPAVVAAAVPLLLVAAVFQLSDGVQAVAAGALRGAGDTRFPLLANLAGHYLLGLPLGVVLAFVAGYGARGLWWGLSAGLTAVALGLSLRFLKLSRAGLERV